jgi:hemoglobin-like flavoprotein
MTPQQIELVQSTWQQVLPIKAAAGSIFYERLFELDPALRPLFRSEIAVQSEKLMLMLDAAVMGLTDLDLLVPVVEKLGVRHAGYGVKAGDYDTVGSALLFTLDKGLGPAFTAPVKDAWTQAYVTLASVMQKAAATP